MLLSPARAPPSAPDVPEFPCLFAKLSLPWSWPSVPLCPCTALPRTPACSPPAFPHGSKRSTTPQAASALPPKRLRRGPDAAHLCTDVCTMQLAANCTGSQRNQSISSQSQGWHFHEGKYFLPGATILLVFLNSSLSLVSSCWRSGQADIGRS